MAENEQTGPVQTVLGVIVPGDLGATLTHEHVLSDLSTIEVPPAEASAREFFHRPFAAEMAGYVTFYRQSNADNLRLDDVETATAELALYRAHGGRSLVEASSVGLSRDPRGLAQVSKATGVNIVMGSSFYVDISHPADMDDRSEEDLAEEIARDITEGVGATGIRAGIIGEVGCSWPLKANERKVLRASAAAQRATGASILIHPGRDERSPDEIITVLGEAGGDLNRTIIGHLERTVTDKEVLLRIAASGCYLEWDHFGFERSHYPPNPRVRMLNDADRMDLIEFVTSRGYGDKVVIAHDVASKQKLTRYGGPVYFYILRHIVPRMRERGFQEEDIDRLLVHNPAAVLTMAEPQGCGRQAPQSP